MKLTPIDRGFYLRNVVEVAKDLLGKVLVRELDHEVLAGLIVEVEAYDGEGDPASHARFGRTERNAIMYDTCGCAYVYLAYGKNLLLNVTAEPPGKPAAVLIRAVEPILGLEQMKKMRGVSRIAELTNGPGRVTQAFGITLSHHGKDLTKGEELYIAHPVERRSFVVKSSPRIGVSAGLDRRWRFFVANSMFVSRRRA